MYSSHTTFHPQLKKRRRVVEKATQEVGASRNPGPPISWIYDVVRGTYIVDTVEELSALLNGLIAAGQRKRTKREKMIMMKKKTTSSEPKSTTGLGFGSSSPRGYNAAASRASSSSLPLSHSSSSSEQNHEPWIEIVRMKNRCAKPLFQGYRDFLLNLAFKLPGGSHHIAELQIHFRQIKLAGVAAKSHETYEYFRSFFVSIGEGGVRKEEYGRGLLCILVTHFCKQAGNLSHVAEDLELFESLGREKHASCDDLVESVVRNTSVHAGTVSLYIIDL